MNEATSSPEPTPSPGQKRLWRLIGVTICLLFAISVVLMWFLFRSGIHVTLQNTGSQPLRSVVIHVTSASYSLGDIPPGATSHATVRPASESHLEIEFTDLDGKPQRLDAGGYFEPGYRGTIRISVKDGVMGKNEQEIGVR